MRLLRGALVCLFWVAAGISLTVLAGVASVLIVYLISLAAP